MAEEFSHIDDKGNAKMVDVGHKPDQQRTAIAGGKIFLQENTVKLIRENNIAKGDVLTVAKIAGIQAAKQTSALIPLCHPLMLNVVDVDLVCHNDGVYVKSTVKCSGKTGVEMEALTAVNIALLTVYDMCKAVDKTMTLSDIKLISKKKD